MEKETTYAMLAYDIKEQFFWLSLHKN